MNCGSRLSFHEPCRCGRYPFACHIPLYTADCDIPSSAASDRVYQRERRGVGGRVWPSNVRVITASTCSSTTVRGRPGRGSSRHHPAGRPGNDERHLRAVPTAH